MGGDATNQHFIVAPAPGGVFLAVWTQASAENEPDQRVVSSVSHDQGHTWAEPVRIDGPDDGDGRIASWAFTFVAPQTGRVYALYNKHVGIEDVRRDTTGELWYRWSDDSGRTWSRDHGTLQIRKSGISHPSPAVPEAWVTYQPPIATLRGEVIVGFTRWASSAVPHGGEGLFERHSEACFLRFDNILSEADPRALRATTLPDGDVGLRVAHPRDAGIGVAQEPSLQGLSDGRIVCLMRTRTGMIWFALSADGSALGELWVELQDPEGRALPGYSLDDAVSVDMNGVAQEVWWRAGPGLDGLTGRQIRVRFSMRSTKLYGFQFLS